MTSKILSIVIAACVGAVIICTAGLGLLGGHAATCTYAGPSAAPQAWTAAGGYTADQVSAAAIIVRAGIDAGVPVRGQVIAVAVAIQESSLQNRSDGPDDSVGLFQQRPSQGWGTRDQLLDPVYASRRFYTALLAVAGWPQMPLTDAGQAVQRSAYPDAYARWEHDATKLVTTVGSSTNGVMSVNIAGCLTPCPDALNSSNAGGTPAAPSEASGACDWVAPVRAPIVSGFRTAGRPSHDGVDLAAARGTPIRVASTGTVLVVRCNVTPASHGCDQDGSPSTPGCGWYVDVLHADQIVTRYCHMLTRPSVVEGQQVLVGQVIGFVGSSGHSSGPHLHFEVHVNGDRSPVGAVDPVMFMAGRAPIGHQ
ncbi:M23 family metallopeptidase [Dactylosporangium cerinum]|uniref:M23 family metallopeptidase n=1 Tax=Dactylosporangium cerinum TaxID=1434730 RepID=A0ABV9WJD1_9ACTN